MKTLANKIIQWYHTLYRGQDGRIIWSASAAGLKDEDYNNCPFHIRKELDTFQSVSKQKYQVMTNTFLGFNTAFIFIATAIGVSYSGSISLVRLLMLMFSVVLLSQVFMDAVTLFSTNNIYQLIKSNSSKIFKPLLFLCGALFLLTTSLYWDKFLLDFQSTLQTITPYLQWAVSIQEYQWIAILFTILALLDVFLVVTPLAKAIKNSYLGWKTLARKNPIWCHRHLHMKHANISHSQRNHFDAL